MVEVLGMPLCDVINDIVDTDLTYPVEVYVTSQRVHTGRWLVPTSAEATKC